MTDTALLRAYDRASVSLAVHHGSDPWHWCKDCNRVHRRWQQLQALLIDRGLPWMRP